MVDLLLSVVGLGSLGGAIFTFYKFVTDTTPSGGKMMGWACAGVSDRFLRLRPFALPAPRE